MLYEVEYSSRTCLAEWLVHVRGRIWRPEIVLQLPSWWVTMQSGSLIYRRVIMKPGQSALHRLVLGCIVMSSNPWVSSCYVDGRLNAKEAAPIMKIIADVTGGIQSNRPYFG
jgi:hypothetical protein